MNEERVENFMRNILSIAMRFCEVRLLVEFIRNEHNERED